MATSNTSTASGGIGITGLLAVLFIALKLLKVIAWSWWWVLSPIWIPFALVAAILIVWLIAISVLAVLK